MRNADRQTNSLPTIAGIRVATALAGQRSPRIGLLEGRTGIPVFLLALESVSRPHSVEVHSAGDVEALLRQCTAATDRTAIESLLAFFEADGSRALVSLNPHPTGDWLTAMLGVDRGLSHRTGLNALGSFTEYADLLVVPQASQHLSPDVHERFHDVVHMQLSEAPHFFFLSDLPVGFDATAARQWAKARQSVDAAVFFPWLLNARGAVSPASVAAAAIQRSDERYGIQRLPSNQPIPGFSPLRRHSPSDLADLVAERVTVFHRFPGQETCLWGGTTLTLRDDADGRFLSTRRTLLAVREAVHNVCEPFVLEPLYPGIENAVDVALQSAFEPLRKFFSSTSKETLSTEVRVERHRGEDVLTIAVTCALPYALGELSFRLGMAA